MGEAVALLMRQKLPDSGKGKGSEEQRGLADRGGKRGWGEAGRREMRYLPLQRHLKAKRERAQWKNRVEKWVVSAAGIRKGETSTRRRETPPPTKLQMMKGGH